MRPIACTLSALSIGVVSLGWAAEAPPSPNSAGARASGLAAPSAIPETAREAIFTPITPCRAVSNRPIAAKATANYLITGTGNFSAQGGPTTGCGIPTYATAIAVTLAAANPSGTGYFTAFAYGSTRPIVTSLNFQSSVTNSTGAHIKIGTGGQISIFSTVAANIYADITGYYAPQIHAVLNPTGGIASGTSRVLSSTKLSTGAYQVTLDRNLTSCTSIASISGGPYFASSYISGNTVVASTYTAAGTATDLYWTLHVLC